MTAAAAFGANPYAVAVIVLVSIGIALAGILREPEHRRARNWFSPVALCAAGLGWICWLVAARGGLDGSLALGLISGCLVAPAAGIVGVIGFRVWGGKWLTIAGLEAALSLPAAALAVFAACSPGCFT